MSESVRQILYISDARFALSEKEIENILKISRQKNSDRAVTGILIYSDGVFIQALEGETDVIGQLYATIADDARHKNVEIISDRTIPKRNFADWAMAYIESSQSEVAHNAGIEGTLNRSEVLDLLSMDEENVKLFLWNVAKSVG